MLRTFIIILLSLLLTDTVQAQVNIWEHSSTTKCVILTPYTASGGDGTAVIICPGGSYFWLDMETEGRQTAEWLQKNGISAFVLSYRTAKVPAFIFHHRLLFRGNRYPDPQDDLRQALNYVRKLKRDDGSCYQKIGVMGFSAGGHLVMSSVELFDKKDWPDFVTAVYPVVTMKDESVHKRSRRGLLGDSRVRNKALRDQLSLECHVPDNCPPVLLVNCKDDPVVDYRNSVLLDKALTEKSIPHRYVQFETGGHGFGASDMKGTAECRKWKNIFLEWVQGL